MYTKKKTRDPHHLLPLYQKCCAICPPDDQQAFWLRIHFLLQGWQAVFDSPCLPDELRMLLHEGLGPLEAHMPLLGELLTPFPMKGPPVSLPTDLLHDLCAIYSASSFPDLGQIYQTIQSPADVLQKGQVFTPHSAVQHAFSLLPHPLEAIKGKVLDLTCGAGDYLLVAYEWLQQEYTARGFSASDAHGVILQEHLYGIDSDPLAVAITHCRLALLCPESPHTAAHVILLNSYHLFAHPLGRQRYEVIVGNPPWGGQIRAEEKRWIRQQATDATPGLVHNSFAYFLECTVRLLAEDGQFSLLVPASLLNVQSYQPLRHWLLTHVRLEALHYVPHLFPSRYAPALFISGLKATPDPDHLVTIYPTALSWAKWSSSASSAPTGNRVHQAVFAKEPQTILNIHHDPELETIFARMRDGAFYLQPKRGSIHKGATSVQARVDFVVGIITGNNKRHISTQPLSAQSMPIYQSSDVEPFRLHPPQHFIVYDKKQLKQVAHERKFHAPEKLLYRYISKELVTAIDRSGSYTLNNTNFLLPIDLPCTLRFLSALLNSTLLNTYYMYHFFTGKVLKGNLCRLPLRMPPPAMREEFEQLVVQLEQEADAEVWQRLNALVYQLYEINPLEQESLEAMYQHLRKFPFI